MPIKNVFNLFNNNSYNYERFFLNTSKYLANAGFALQVAFIASLACFQLFMNDVYASITGFLENWKKKTQLINFL